MISCTSEINILTRGAPSRFADRQFILKCTVVCMNDIFVLLE